MKRFWREVRVEPVADGWQVALDGRAIKSQGGRAQVLPTQAMAELLAREWRAQGEDVDPRGFVFRDMADYAIDHVRPDREGTIAKLLSYAETDTLCYRADPEDALFRRQQELWEPLVAACEARHAVRLARVSGIVHRPQSDETLAALRQQLEKLDEFTLAALTNLASLSASLVVALTALEPGADPAALFAAANAEEDWQAELWGWDLEAENVRASKLKAFEMSCTFARAASR